MGITVAELSDSGQWTTRVNLPVQFSYQIRGTPSAESSAAKASGVAPANQASRQRQ